MAELSPGEVRRQLPRKFGFVSEGGTRHEHFVLRRNGELVAYCDVSRGTSPFRDRLIGLMASQAHVRPRIFVGMIQCSVSKERYLEILAG